MDLKLDLHDVFNKREELETRLSGYMDQAIEKKARTLVIIPGKGSGQLKKHVLRFIERKYKGRYHRIVKDKDNWGKVVVHFRWI